MELVEAVPIDDKLFKSRYPAKGKESWLWSLSFEYPQHIFWLRNRKSNFLLRTLIWGPAHTEFRFSLYEDDTKEVMDPAVAQDETWVNHFQSRI